MKAYRAAHILVTHEYEAEDLLKKLARGENFEDVARKYSSCSSAPNGGHLGLIKIGKAAEEFEEAALSLKPDQTTPKPIRTRFGYHIIKRLKD